MLQNRVQVSHSTWKTITSAMLERIEAVELFMADLAGRFRFQSELSGAQQPLALLLEARKYLKGAQQSLQGRSWLSSMDIACDSNQQFWFVDDHFCCPFGLLRLKQLTDASGQPDDRMAFEKFSSAAQRSIAKFSGPKSAIVLGSSTFSTAYREHRFYSEWLGLPYVTRTMLRTEKHGLFFRDSGREKKVSLVIRRLQDDDLDPLCFRPDSLQGVQGLVKAARRGLVTVFNAPGTGLFNSRLLTSLIPQMIRHYLGREPLLPSVPTREADALELYPASKDADFREILRTDNAMDLLRPSTGSTLDTNALLRFLTQHAGRPRSLVMRTTIADASGGADPLYSFRTFCVGQQDRNILKGGIARDCAADGTPLSPIVPDQSVRLLSVDD